MKRIPLAAAPAARLEPLTVIRPSRGWPSAPGVWSDLAGAERSGTGEARFTAVRYRGDEAVGNGVKSGRAATFELAVTSAARRSVDCLAVTVYASNGTRLVSADTRMHGRMILLEAGENRFELRLAALHLTRGTYGVGLRLAHDATVPRLRRVR